MAKRLSAVVGEYTDKEGKQKAEWLNVGVIGIDKNGKEYVLLDPNTSVAGALLKQNILAQKRGEQPRDTLMTSVFEDQPPQHQAQQNSYNAPQQQQGSYQQPQQPQGGYPQQPNNYQR